MRAISSLTALLLICASTCFSAVPVFKSVQATLDKKEIEVENSEAMSDELLGSREAAKIHYRKMISYYTNIYNDPSSSYPSKLSAVRVIGVLKIRCEDYQGAIDILKGFLAQYPGNKPVSNDLAEALYFKAMNYTSSVVKEEREKAIEIALSILDMKNIDLDWQPFMKHYIGSRYAAEGNYDKALFWYNKVISDHPDSKDWAARAHLSIAWYYKDLHENSKAKEHLKIIITQYSNSSCVKLAQNWLKELK